MRNPDRTLIESPQEPFLLVHGPLQKRIEFRVLFLDLSKLWTTPLSKTEILGQQPVTSTP